MIDFTKNNILILDDDARSDLLKNGDLISSKSYCDSIKSATGRLIDNFLVDKNNYVIIIDEEFIDMTHRAFYSKNTKGMSYGPNLLGDMVSLKEDKELELKKKEESLRAKIEAKYAPPETATVTNDDIKKIVCGVSGSFNIDLIKAKLKLIDIGEDYINDRLIDDSVYALTLDYSDYRDIIKEYQAIKQIHKLVRSLTKQISFLFNLVKKRLRNLRQVFTKQHSFHFKNLDDYHSSALTLSF